MTFNVNEMVSSLNRSGVSRTSDFTVECFAPRGDAGLQREMQMRAVAAELPGRSIITKEYKPSNIGPFNRMPYGQTYADITVRFLASEDLRERYYFERWQNQMLDTGAFLETAGVYRPGSRFTNKYFDEYAGTITVTIYNQGGGISAIFKLNEAYPLFIGPTPLNWDQSDLVVFPVTFAFKNYELRTEGSSQPRLGNKFSFNVGPNGVSVGGVLRNAEGNITGSVGAGPGGIQATVPGVGGIRATQGGVDFRVAKIGAALNR